VTSADEGRGLLFTTDRDAKQLSVVDPKTMVDPLSEVGWRDPWG
jgi:hypothetical protein